MSAKNITKTELLPELASAQQNLLDFSTTLTDAQWQRTDHAGWTVKDHLMHLADWSGSVAPLLRKEPRHEAMNLPEKAWIAGDYDSMNETLRQRSLHSSRDDVMNAIQTEYAATLAELENVGNEDLQQPYVTFQPHEDPQRRNYPVIYMLYHIYVEHYDEHIGYIRAILTA